MRHCGLANHLAALPVFGAIVCLALQPGPLWADEQVDAPADPGTASKAEAGTDAEQGDVEADEEPVRDARRSQRVRVRQRAEPTPGPSAEIEVPKDVRDRVLGNDLHSRLSTVARAQRFMGSAPAGGRWQRNALGGGDALPMLTNFSRSVLRTMNLKDGSRVWLATGNMNEPGAILRLGDLLPLFSVIGVRDREVALAVKEISFGGGAQPPSYTATLRTGVLWPHRNALMAAEQSDRVVFSFVTGRLTVLGGLVVADSDGELSVRLLPPMGDDVDRYRTLIMPEHCRPLEDALRSDEPGSAVDEALELLEQPSVVQTCAARYLAIAAPDVAGDHLRELVQTGRVGRPDDVVEALAHIEPDLSDENRTMVLRMVDRLGASGINAVCRHAPFHWADEVLESDDVPDSHKRAMRRCLRQ